MEENIELPDSTTLEQGPEPITPESDKPEFSENEKRLYARVKKLEAENKEYKLSEPSKVGDDIRKDITELKQEKAKRDFGYRHSLSPEETDEVFAYATGKGVKPEEAKESPFVKSALDSFRAQRRSEQAALSPSGHSAVIEGKTFADMTHEERSKNFSKVAERFQG